MTRYFKTGELRHHGIDGQKWGVRNGPPYPLSREKHAEVVRDGYQRNRNVKKKKTEGISHIADKFDRRWKEVVEASDLDKPTNVAELLANPEYVKYHMLKNRNGRQYINEWDIKNVNYGGPKEPGQSHNCTKCTVALEMRRRGYDVFAGRTFEGHLKTAPVYWFDNAVEYKATGIDSFCESLAEKLGNNGTAALSFSYKSGSGHSMYAYHEDDGTFKIIDGQTGDYWWSKKVSGKSPKDQVKGAMELVQKYYDFDMENKTSSFVRLDTATPNFEHMAEDSVLRKLYTNPSMNQMIRDDGKYAGEIFERKEPDGSRTYGFRDITDQPHRNGVVRKYG